MENIRIDTHNYLAASDIVIAKDGWGTISEALLSKRNLLLIEREVVLGKCRGIAVSIKESALARIDIDALGRLISQNIIRENLDAYENAIEEVVKVLIPDQHA